MARIEDAVEQWAKRNGYGPYDERIMDLTKALEEAERLEGGVLDALLKDEACQDCGNLQADFEMLQMKAGQYKEDAEESRMRLKRLRDDLVDIVQGIEEKDYLITTKEIPNDRKRLTSCTRPIDT